MQQYKYTVKWIPGSMNIADSLSRLLPHSAKKTTQRDDDNEYIRFVAEEATPKAISTKEIERASDDDSELSSIRECLLTNRWYSIENKQYLPVRFELSAIGKLVLRGTRIVIPESLRDRILTLAHEGHPGIVNMKKILRSKIWWPGNDKQVEQFCKSCYGCQLVSQTTKPEPMARTELPAGPWQHLAADLLGPLPTGESILVLVDYYSRFFEVEIMKSTTSDKVIKAINKFFVTHGLPLSLQTDNGPQFVSESFKNFLSENGITHRRTTPLWPQANGEVERQNRSILKRIRIAHASGRDWKEDLLKYLAVHRSTPNATTGASKAELLYRRKFRTKLPELGNLAADDLEVRDKDCENKGKGKLYSDVKRRACENDIKAGDSVLVRQDKTDKFSTVFNPRPFTLVEKKGNSVKIESDTGNQYKRNVTEVKRFNKRSGVDYSFTKHESDFEIPDNVEGPMPQSNYKPELHTPAQETASNASLPSTDMVNSPRPVRTRRMPEKLKDYEVKM
ncbi:MAG: DDE-type integrase/transposase/recombinase [Candidatus Thiodiazotropha taylori]|nr:DDE-type integrase/transposase/recombinase [Candidatus Thiodiazotropha taylori]MCW4333826.1 DDE-type integrase/transposase/recombinase [Candidatus Thiodiazotropha endolucinida]